MRYSVKWFLLVVSQNCDIMNLWKLKDFTTLSGRHITAEWCKDVDDIVWLGFALHMDYLCDQPRSNWVFPYVRQLSGGKKKKKKGCAGLYELRFDVGNVEYRPLGYFTGEWEFTILFFAEERGDEFVPPNACETAKKRQAVIDADKERAREFIIEENINEETATE